MKKKENNAQIVQAASNVEAAHNEVKNARKNEKQKRTMYLASKKTAQEKEAKLQTAKDALEEQLLLKN